jgi:hypothetical protein
MDSKLGSTEKVTFLPRSGAEEVTFLPDRRYWASLRV